MRATVPLSRGFWGRSAEELKRLSNIVIKMEGIKGPSGPYELYNFHNADSIKGCRVMCDTDIGGSSVAHLDWVPPSATQNLFSSPSLPPSAAAAAKAATPSQPTSPSSSSSKNGYARFHGNISTALPPNQPKIERTGFAAFRTLDRGANLFGPGTWDMGMYAFLALRIRTDGRSYLINVQTEGVVASDLHQHRLFSKRGGGKGGEWETVVLSWNDFVRTNHGFVVEPQTEILRHKIRSVGVGLTDRVPGPFELHIERIWATNNLDDADGPKEEDGAGRTAVETSELTDKKGHKIRW